MNGGGEWTILGVDGLGMDGGVNGGGEWRG